MRNIVILFLTSLIYTQLFANVLDKPNFTVGEVCKNEYVQLNAITINPNYNYYWTVNGESYGGESIELFILNQLVLNVTLRITKVVGNESVILSVYSQSFDVEDCRCLQSFHLNKNKKYLFTAWVKKTNSNYESSYNDVWVQLISSSGDIIFNATPSGNIIDRWQKIERVVDIQDYDVSDVYLAFTNEDVNSTLYIDDIRLIPFDSSMKSFVYDMNTRRLVAELDQNHYATYYEYDAEGNLIRIAKDTERGKKTISEYRQHLIHKN